MGATIKDIARVTGLSIATVSKCINGQVVKAENRLLIEKTIEELGYVRDESARSMKTGRSGFIAIVVPTLEIPMIGVFVRECQSLLIKKGLTPVICVSENDENREQYIISKLEAYQIDGMIVMPVSRGTTRAYDYLKNNNRPFVFFDQFIPAYPSNCVALCGDDAIEELMIELKKLGHKNIGVVLGTKSLHSFDRRSAMISKYAEKHGIGFSSQYMISGDSSGLDCVKQLMSLEPSPTAVICLSENAAVSTYFAFSSLGFSVPDDISLIGTRNGDEIDRTLPIDLTLLDQPIHCCAEACVETFYEMLMLKYDKKPVGSNSRRVDINMTLHRGKTIGKAKI